MKPRSLDALAQRRAELVARCDMQRAAFATHSHAVTGTLSGIDIGMDLFKRIKKSPLMIAGLVAALVVIKPLRVLPLLQTGFTVWQTVRSMLPKRDKTGPGPA